MPTLTTDPTAATRKADHIELAFRSQVEAMSLDRRFHYEPLLAGHPTVDELPVTPFGDKYMRAPLWVSSMTGGTEQALTINRNLAQACAEFGLGIGLGSCRPLLEGTERLVDFDIRPLTGEDVPLFANLGVAQLQDIFDRGGAIEVRQMVDLLRADGLIIHVNPLQEAMQPEGDVFRVAPLATVQAALRLLPGLPLIVKEVGQGMGPASLRALLRLPLLAVDTAAGGGTNFAKLELFRGDDQRREAYAPLVAVGHHAAEMVDWTNEILADEPEAIGCRHLIVSGGLRNFLDGYYLLRRARLPALYGQASALLRYAQEDYGSLQHYVRTQLHGLALAYAYLRPRD